MARPTRIMKTPMAQAISRFRQALGDTQQQFANRVGLAVTSVARYETNSPPSLKVLARFVEIARIANLPSFTEIFERRLPPSEEIEHQDFAVVKQLLTRMIEDLRPNQLRQARVALACLLTSTAKLNEIERRMDGPLAETDKVIEDGAAELVRGRDPEVDKKRLRFLRTRNLDHWFDFTQAYDAFRQSRLAELFTKGGDKLPLFDMFVVREENPGGVPFELTEEKEILRDHHHYPPAPKDCDVPSEQEINYVDTPTVDDGDHSALEIIESGEILPPMNEEDPG
jgi:transcriptional regulator with XRE-family HTH domain